LIVAVVLGILGVFCILGWINWISAIRLESGLAPNLSTAPKVSVLIPARNEEENLKSLLQSWIKSKIKPDEILVLDDQSTDRTAQVAEEILQESGLTYRVIHGNPWSPQTGMNGKNHACQQLADEAIGEVLLFCDADLIVSELALGRTLSILQTYSCAGLSGFPRQRALGYRERLVLPWILQLPLILSIPLGWAWKSGFPSAQVANGQWLAIWRKSYQKIGGHRELGWEVLEDVAIARRMTRLKLGGMIPVLASQDLEVTMYQDWEHLIKGFSKNLVLLFGGSKFRTITLLMITNLVFTFPFWGWLINFPAMLIGLILVLFCRLTTARLFRMKLSDVGLHLTSLYFLNQLVYEVIFRHQTGPIHWKGRPIQVRIEGENAGF